MSDITKDTYDDAIAVIMDQSKADPQSLEPVVKMLALISASLFGIHRVLRERHHE